MADAPQHKLGGETIPAGSDEMFIGPDQLRVIVSSEEERLRWQQVHDEQMAAVAPPVAEAVLVAEPVAEMPVAEPETAEPEVEAEPVADHETKRKRRSR